MAWPFLMVFPIKNGDFPLVSSPEGTKREPESYKNLYHRTIGPIGHQK